MSRSIEVDFLPQAFQEAKERPDDHCFEGRERAERGDQERAADHRQLEVRISCHVACSLGGASPAALAEV